MAGAGKEITKSFKKIIMPKKIHVDPYTYEQRSQQIQLYIKGHKIKILGGEEKVKKWIHKIIDQAYTSKITRKIQQG